MKMGVDRQRYHDSSLDILRIDGTILVLTRLPSHSTLSAHRSHIEMLQQRRGGAAGLGGRISAPEGRDYFRSLLSEMATDHLRQKQGLLQTKSFIFFPG